MSLTLSTGLLRHIIQVIQRNYKYSVKSELNHGIMKRKMINYSTNINKMTTLFSIPT